MQIFSFSSEKVIFFAEEEFGRAMPKSCACWAQAQLFGRKFPRAVPALSRHSLLGIPGAWLAASELPCLAGNSKKLCLHRAGTAVGWLAGEGDFQRKARFSHPFGPCPPPDNAASSRTRAKIV